jgi:hypothetical protein
MSNSFQKFAGLCAILAAVVGLLYSVSFVILKNDLLNALFLTLGGVFTSAVFIALYHKLRATDESFALLAFVFGLLNVAGVVMHGGYDLANAINVPASIPPNLADLPSQVDPRGLMTFGAAAISIFVTAWLITRGAVFPKNLAYLGHLLAVMLIVIYLGRLIVLQATSPLILGPAALTGFILNPLWYLWLGVILWRGR